MWLVLMFLLGFDEVFLLVGFFVWRLMVENDCFIVNLWIYFLIFLVNWVCVIGCLMWLKCWFIWVVFMWLVLMWLLSDLVWYERVFICILNWKRCWWLLCLNVVMSVGCVGLLMLCWCVVRCCVCNCLVCLMCCVIGLGSWIFMVVCFWIWWVRYLMLMILCVLLFVCIRCVCWCLCVSVLMFVLMKLVLSVVGLCVLCVSGLCWLMVWLVWCLLVVM